MLSLFAEVTKEQKQQYLARLKEVEGLKPTHVGISPYLTLDETSNLEEVYHRKNKAARQTIETIPEETSMVIDLDMTQNW